MIKSLITYDLYETRTCLLMNQKILDQAHVKNHVSSCETASASLTYTRKNMPIKHNNIPFDVKRLIIDACAKIRSYYMRLYEIISFINFFSKTIDDSFFCRILLSWVNIVNVCGGWSIFVVR